MVSGRRFSNMPTEADEYEARIVLGRVVNVRFKNYAVDVSADHDGAVYENVQVGMPYFHFAGGEGIYCMPEVGAHCAIVIPSESSDPFVLCFLGVNEDITEGEAETETSDETEDSESDEPKSTDLDISYRNNRPPMRPGDICFRTRDGNFVHLRRGGIIQIGSTAVAQRLYIPIRNFIKDFAENYSLETAGGKMSWELVNEDDEHNGSVQRFVWREYGEQALGSVMCSVGQLGDNYYDFVMAPELIDTQTGEIKGDAILRITFSKEGEYIRTCTKETLTVNGDRKIVITGKHEEDCDEYIQKVGSSRTIEFNTEKKTGKESVEDLTTKDIRAQNIYLGGTLQSAVFGDALLDWLQTHTHSGTVTPAGIVTITPPVPPPPPALLLSKKVKIG